MFPCTFLALEPCAQMHLRNCFVVETLPSTQVTASEAVIAADSSKIKLQHAQAVKVGQASNVVKPQFQCTPNLVCIDPSREGNLAFSQNYDISSFVWWKHILKFGAHSRYLKHILKFGVRTRLGKHQLPIHMLLLVGHIREQGWPTSQEWNTKNSKKWTNLKICCHYESSWILTVTTRSRSSLLTVDTSMPLSSICTSWCPSLWIGSFFTSSSRSSRFSYAIRAMPKY